MISFQTLQTLGFVISTQKHVELLKSIPIDSQGQASMDGKSCRCYGREKLVCFQYQLTSVVSFKTCIR